MFQGLQGSLKPGTCPACAGDNRTIQFDWQVLLQGQPKLVLAQKFQFGSLLQCALCRQFWYLDAGEEKITFVPKDRVPLLKTWGTTPLSLSGELFQKAKTIGATPIHDLARRAQYAEVPCRAKTRDGRWADKCLLIFTDAPPLEPDFGDARLLEEVVDIEPSAYALPAKVRLATCHSKADEKGNARTWVRTDKDKLLSLNWTVNFVDYKKTKGSELTLVSEKDPTLKKKMGKMALLQEPASTLTFFMGHWSKEISKLGIS